MWKENSWNNLRVMPVFIVRLEYSYETCQESQCSGQDSKWLFLNTGQQHCYLEQLAVFFF